MCITVLLISHWVPTLRYSMGIITPLICHILQLLLIQQLQLNSMVIPRVEVGLWLIKKTCINTLRETVSNSKIKLIMLMSKQEWLVRPLLRMSLLKIELVLQVLRNKEFTPGKQIKPRWLEDLRIHSWTSIQVLLWLRFRNKVLTII